MKFKFIKKASATALLTVMFSSSVLAAWHASTITLPRNGWWTTVARTAEHNTQETRVERPKYDVVSNIKNTNGTFLSSNSTHDSGKDTKASHTTNAKGSKVKAAFRSSYINQNTNRVRLSWEP
ncbi:TPA: hypothetical protein ACTZ34_005146 [Bacillus cereus]